ncbi:helix-turn-helix transcriptional regulator [Testudinibacter sp. P27/CKL/0425]
MNIQPQIDTTENRKLLKQLLTLKEVKTVTGLSTTTIYKHMEAGEFPKPKKCGSRAVRWRLADIESYINA